MASRVLSKTIKSFIPQSHLRAIRGMATATQQQGGVNTVRGPGNTENINMDPLTDSLNTSDASPRGMSRRGARPLLPGGVFDLWSPITTSRSMRQMLDTVNRLFDTDMFGSPLGMGLLDQPARSSSMRTPWDIVEKENAYHLRIDMPGFEKSDVNIHVEGDELVLKAEKSGSDDVFGTQRSMNTRMLLPQEAVKDQIKAELKNGVLTITVPKEEVSEDKRHVVVNVE